MYYIVTMAYDAAAQRKYHQRQRADRRGLVRVTVWVPKDAREHVVALAERLRELKRKRARQ